MYRRAGVALISFWSLLAVAGEDWQVVAETSLGQLKMDKESVARDGKYTAAVLMYEFKELQTQATPPNAVFNKRRDDLLVDCSSRSLGLHTSRFFEDAKLADTRKHDLADVKFSAAALGSMAATVVNAVCAAALKTAR